MAEIDFASALGTLVVAAGGLGLAATGVVDALKFTRLGASGFAKLKAAPGPDTEELLEAAYGENVMELLEAQYRNGRSAGELPKTLRQGVRVGLTKDNAAKMAEFLSIEDSTPLVDAVTKIAEDKDREDINRQALGRYEIKIDARIKAGLGLAEVQYKKWLRIWAMIVALVLALIATGSIIYAQNGTLICAEGGSFLCDSGLWLKAIIVGFVAVPIAPISKDVAKGLQAASKAMRTKI